MANKFGFASINQQINVGSNSSNDKFLSELMN